MALASAQGVWAEQHLAGFLEYRDDRLTVRLSWDEESYEATLELPELWYAGEPAQLERAEHGTLRLALPFGIGTIPLRATGDGFAGDRDGFSLTLKPGAPPPFTTTEVRFGAHAPELGGTLYLPDPKPIPGEIRSEPSRVPAVVLVGGSNSADRSRWSYRSRADWYARRGVAALVYDRRPWEQSVGAGRPVDFWSHAEDLAAARELLAADPRIDGQAIGAHAGSQGVWIALIDQDRTGGFAWLVFTGAPAVTPAEQQLQSLVQGMKDDGLPPEAIADAVAYQRLYFAVAHRGEDWEVLERAVAGLEGTAWGSYVDQPRSLEDLDWWHRHMNYDPGDALSRLRVPLLVLIGGRDWVVPAARNLPLFEFYGHRAGNEAVTTLMLEGADHRLEVPPGPDATGQWRFFRIHPEARRAIEQFLDTRALQTKAQ